MWLLKHHHQAEQDPELNPNQPAKFDRPMDASDYNTPAPQWRLDDKPRLQNWFYTSQLWAK